MLPELLSNQLLDACVNNCGKRFHLEVCSREFEGEVRRLITKAPHIKVGEKVLQLVKKWAAMKEFKDDPQLNLMPTLYRHLKKEGYIFSSSDRSERPSRKLPSDPNVVTSNQEEEDIAKAIAESLKSSASSPPSSSQSKSSHYAAASSSNSKSSNSVYPSFDSELTNGTNGRHTASSAATAKDSGYQVRALYDFEAAEDNELTFKAGEIIVVMDDRYGTEPLQLCFFRNVSLICACVSLCSSDTNWWKGSNHRGDGLFPANFVTTDLSEEPEPAVAAASASPAATRSVQFNEEVRIKVIEEEPKVVTIDPEKIDRLIGLLHEADPTGEEPDSDELISLEGQSALYYEMPLPCVVPPSLIFIAHSFLITSSDRRTEQVMQMAPLIDEELQKVDRNLALLNTVNSQLVEVMNMYLHYAN